MNNKGFVPIALIVIAAVVIVGLGGYLFLQQKEGAVPRNGESPPQTIVDTSTSPVPPVPSTTSSPPQNPPAQVTLRGEFTCLLPRDTTGSQTLECAFGLRDARGDYYAVRDSDPTYKNLTSLPMGVQVEMTGVLTLQQDARYQSIGVLEVFKATRL